MEKVLVFGHKNPDTDSVSGAISLAYLKNIKKKKEYIPYILGEVNNETKYVLNYFNVKTPEFLEDVKLQIRDIDYFKKLYINENDSI